MEGDGAAANGRVLAGAPFFLPEDTAIPVDEVPAESQMTRDFVADEEILLREQLPALAWVSGLAYALMGLVAAAWVGAFARGTRQLRLTVPEMSSAPDATHPVPPPPA